MEQENTNVNVNEEKNIDDSTVAKTESTPKEKTFTQEEVNSIIEKRLAKEKSKLEEKVKTEFGEAQRLATLSESERAKELYEKELNSFKEEKAKFEREKLLLETNKQLIAKNLPTDFANHLISSDAESTLNNINAFEKTWQEAINKELSKKIKGSTPTKPIKEESPITQDSFKRMSLLEQSKLAQQNPKLYEDLIFKK